MASRFHTRLRLARERSSLSQAELADKFDVTGPTISNWEHRVSEPWNDQRDRVLKWIAKVEMGGVRHRRGVGPERSEIQSQSEQNTGAEPPQARRKLPSNLSAKVPMMVLQEADVRGVTALLSHVPEYSSQEWRRLVANAIGAIHQIPRLLQSKGLPNLDLKDVEAYFGRLLLRHHVYRRQSVPAVSSWPGTRPRVRDRLR